MGGPRVVLVSTCVIVVLVVGCGDDELPLPDGTEVTSERTDCPAVPDVCVRHLLVEGPAGAGSSALRDRVAAYLRGHGWRTRPGIHPTSVAAYSPDGKRF